MLLVVMTLGSLTTGVAEEELLDLPVVGLYLKMGVECSVLFAQLRACIGHWGIVFHALFLHCKSSHC